MLVMNTFENDSRVDRSARTLVEQGYDVTLLCLYRKGLPRRERYHGYEVIRCNLEPEKGDTIRLPAQLLESLPQAKELSAQNDRPSDL